MRRRRARRDLTRGSAQSCCSSCARTRPLVSARRQCSAQSARLNQRFETGAQIAKQSTGEATLSLGHPDIIEHRDRLRVIFAADRQFCRIHARRDSRVGRTTATAGGAAAARVCRAATRASPTSRAAKRRRDERPLNAVNARRRRCRRRAQCTARGIDDRELHVARRRRLEVIADRRTARWVGSDEVLVASQVRIGSMSNSQATAG